MDSVGFPKVGCIAVDVGARRYCRGVERGACSRVITAAASLNVEWPDRMAGPPGLEIASLSVTLAIFPPVASVQ